MANDKMETIVPIGYKQETIEQLAKMLDDLEIKGIKNAQILSDIVKILTYAKIPVAYLPPKPAPEEESSEEE